MQDGSREDTRGPQDASPICHVTPMNPIIEARFDRLKVGYEHHENKLNEHDTRLKEHKARLAKQDSILEKSNEILQSLKNTHCEHSGWTRVSPGIATSYLRWHGDNKVVDSLEVENMDQFYEVRRLLRLGFS